MNDQKESRLSHLHRQFYDENTGWTITRVIDRIHKTHHITVRDDEETFSYTSDEELLTSPCGVEVGGFLFVAQEPRYDSRGNLVVPELMCGAVLEFVMETGYRT